MDVFDVQALGQPVKRPATLQELVYVILNVLNGSYQEASVLALPVGMRVAIFKQWQNVLIDYLSGFWRANPKCASQELACSVNSLCISCFENALSNNSEFFLEAVIRTSA